MVLLWWHSVFLYVAHAILILLDFQEKIYQVNIFDFYRCSENSKRSKAQKLRTDDTKRFTVQLNGAHDFVLETFHYSYFILFYFLSLTVTQFLQIRKITEYQKKKKKKPSHALPKLRLRITPPSFKFYFGSDVCYSDN